MRRWVWQLQYIFFLKDEFPFDMRKTVIYIVSQLLKRVALSLWASQNTVMAASADVQLSNLMKSGDIHFRSTECNYCICSVSVDQMHIFYHCQSPQ